jgi:hypothetical protein
MRRENIMYIFTELLNLGISREDATALRRISMTLHRWHELECGDTNNFASVCLVRGKRAADGRFTYDEAGKPYLERLSRTANNPIPTYTLIPDRERGALRRLAAIMSRYPKLTSYVQTDPRGPSLYIGKHLQESNYTDGVAVYQ